MIADSILAVLVRIDDKLDKVYKLLKSEQSTGATALTLTISGGTMPNSLSVDATDGLATVQFTDDHGDPTAGPNDPTAGTPIVPVVTSDTTTVETVAAGVAGTTPGQFTYALTEVAVGTANLSVAPLVDSAGNPVLDSAGVAFTDPAPVQVTVTAGAASGLTLSVSG